MNIDELSEADLPARSKMLREQLAGFLWVQIGKCFQRRGQPRYGALGASRAIRTLDLWINGYVDGWSELSADYRVQI